MTSIISIFFFPSSVLRTLNGDSSISFRYTLYLSLQPHQVIFWTVQVALVNFYLSFISPNFSSLNLFFILIISSSFTPSCLPTSWILDLSSSSVCIILFSLFCSSCILVRIFFSSASTAEILVASCASRLSSFVFQSFVIFSMVSSSICLRWFLNLASSARFHTSSSQTTLYSSDSLFTPAPGFPPTSQITPAFRKQIKFYLISKELKQPNGERRRFNL